MQLSFSSLLLDTKNFIHNKFKIILIALIAVAVIEQLICMVFMPDPATLAPIQHLLNHTISTYGDNSMQSMQKMIESMSSEQQKELFSTIFSYIFQFVTLAIAISCLTTAFNLSLISNLVNYTPLNSKELFSKATKSLLTIFLSLLVGIPYFAILFILASLLFPLMFYIIAAGVLFYTIIFNLFIVYDVEAHNLRFVEKLNNSWQIFKAQYKSILLITAIWLGLLMVFNLLNSPYDIDNHFVLNVGISFISLLINFFMFTYLYRLCSLIRINN
jgi:hypothetical protein